jgi:hypothetical protein
MISFAEPLSAGNAVRLHLQPPRGALEWRVLRRPTDDFTGHADAGAVRVGPDYGPRPGSMLDTYKLLNGFEVVYRFYWRDEQGWHAGASRRVTPAATYQGEGPDAQALVRERIALGLAEEIKRGALKPHDGKIHVVTAIFGAPDEKKLPAVSVHLDTDMPAHRFLGEQMETEVLAGLGSETGHASEGQFSRVALNVVGISLNGDERTALRKALKRIVIANMAVFDEAGLYQCEFAQRDDEEPGANGAVLYRANGSFACTAPAVVAWPVTLIRDVVVTASFPAEPAEDPNTDG